ncbi:MAG: LLM class flavin-dependent oxidoreductase [Actinomycetota bacterium]|nr:LLM class flavin-dependent oxidoreductase [Actinomycetota bacterium]
MIRYDLRVAPDNARVTHAQQYSEALQMARWADERGFAAVGLSEHHGTDDGFMNSPLTLAAAILGGTRSIAVSINALLVPLHDPVRLAEEIATIDLIAPGRLSVTVGLGYRPEEFDMFGKELPDRVRDFEDAVRLMLDAWQTGDATYRGRTVRIRPRPATTPHPALVIGGSVPASARRAARFGLPYCPAVPDQRLAEIYYAEAAAVGFTNPVAMLGTSPGLVLVTRDPDAVWAEIGPNLLYDAQIYESWQGPEHKSSWRTAARTVEELRTSPNYAVVTPEQCVALVQLHGMAVLHPLVAGIDPRIGWETLELVHSEVMPALAAASPAGT